MLLVLEVINVPDANVKPGSPIMPWLVEVNAPLLQLRF